MRLEPTVDLTAVATLKRVDRGIQFSKQNEAFARLRRCDVQNQYLHSDVSGTYLRTDTI